MVRSSISNIFKKNQMKIILLSFCSLLKFSIFSQTKISGKVDLLETPVSYYIPFSDYVNRNVPSFTETDKNGYFNINFIQSNPSVVKFIIGNIPFELVLEPNDSVYVSFDNNNSLTISGSNASGHNYYAKIFDNPRMKKFDGIRNIFELNRKVPIDKFVGLIKKEFINKTLWLDSLEYQKKVSKTYAEYLKYEIIGTLSWETGNLIDTYFSTLSNVKLKEKLFELANPQNEKLFSSIGGEMYVSMVYLPFIFEKISKADTSKIIVPDVPFFLYAPEKYKKYLWGTNLIVSLEFAPEMYNYCELFKKYIRLYGENEITKYLEKGNICNSKPMAKNNEKIKIVESSETDFFTFLNTTFPNKRLYIDLWATWCGPCKLEFSITPKKFHSLLEKYNIEPVYLSIDEDDKKNIWKTSVQQLQIEGTHIILNKELIKSIQEIIYDGKDISIPRYILINENGKILSTDAPRPSDPKLSKVFDELLKK
jgi:thiol-disulfide isomerase/thioredoxin